MAYPAIPGRRVPYHIFGIGWDRSSSVGSAQLTPAQLAAANDESSTQVNTGGGAPYGFFDVTIAFQIPVTVSGIWVYGAHSSSNEAPYYRTSDNTTNGLDGTWSANIPLTVETSPSWRGSIASVNYPACTGLRFSSGLGGTGAYGYLYGAHVYGTFDYPGLNVCDTSGAITTGPYWDYGDRVRGFSTTKQFKVKNTHSTLKANGVVIGSSIPTDASPSMASQFTYSVDGGAYATTQNIGDLNPGELSTKIITQKYDAPLNAQVGTWSGRITLTATSWT